MIAIHTTAISLASESKKSGSCCPKKVSSDHNTGQITSNFIFMQFGFLLTAPKRKKVENSKFHFFDKMRGCPPLRQDPLEAILVIFGRRALIFFLFETSWKKMKNDATLVRMRSGDHLGDAKMSKKGTSLRRI